jgi:ribose transport system ATP-binding protein
LITNELITNAIKYAFAKKEDGGIIVIETKQVDDFVLLIIKDNGVGLSENFKLEDAETLGFQIVYSLVMQHDGTLDCHMNNGTEFYIKLKSSRRSLFLDAKLRINFILLRFFGNIFFPFNEKLFQLY